MGLLRQVNIGSHSQNNDSVGSETRPETVATIVSTSFLNYCDVPQKLELQHCAILCLLNSVASQEHSATDLLTSLTYHRINTVNFWQYFHDVLYKIHWGYFLELDTD